MSLIDLDMARAHLRLESDYPADQIEPYLRAAESAAAQFLNRAIFPDVESLQAASLGVPASLDAAVQAHSDALVSAASVADAGTRCMLADEAGRALYTARYRAREVLAGIVADPDVLAAVLMILGHLFEHREEVVSGTVSELPRGAKDLLMPHRIGWGI